MDKLRLLFLKVVFVLVLLSGFIYFSFLYILPPVLSSSTFLGVLNSSISKRLDVNVQANSFKFKSYPNLTFDISADKIRFSDSKIQLLKAEKANINVDLKTTSLQKISFDYIYVDEVGIKRLFSKKNNSHKSKINIKKIPEIFVKNSEIWIDKDTLDSIFITVSNLNIYSNNDKAYCKFEAEIISNLLKNTVKVGEQGYILIEDDTIYANELEVLFGLSRLVVNGQIIDKDKNNNLSITGKNIPISDIKASLLYFQKIKDSSKKFIENFYDFSGEMDVDLKVKNNGIFGNCIANNLAAKTTLFNVPILFNKVDFIFEDKSVYAASTGSLGGEKVYTWFKVSNMASGGNHEVTGEVHSDLSNKVVNKYIPDMSVKGVAQTSVKYRVKNKKIDVSYLVKLNKGSDLHYKKAFLGLNERDRRLFVQTLKEGDRLSISNYDYSFIVDDKVLNIIYGDGLFLKKDGHFAPSFISCKTNGFAPISVTGSFGEYIDGGYFNGDLKYDFDKHILSGIFIVKDSRYKDFFLNEAKVFADTEDISITANGNYMSSPFLSSFKAQNSFNKRLHVYNMYLFLDEYVLPTSISTQKNKSSFNILKATKKLDVDIDKWIIKVNKIKRKKVELSNILISGNLNDDVFCFSMPHVNFAKGLLNANGVYNFKDNSSDIIFSAENIDSNVVADVIFDLPNQIQGTANATLHAKTKNIFNDVNAYATFALEDGYLPQIGSTKFIIKKSRKIKHPFSIKLSNIVNIDVKNMRALSSDIKGSFYFDNNRIYDANVTSSQKYLAMLIEGDYNLDKQDADLNLFAKYNNKEISRVKIFFVPLSWVMKFIFKEENTRNIYKDKLKQIPNIKGAEEEKSAFRVKMKGNLNKKDLKVELKSII